MEYLLNTYTVERGEMSIGLHRRQDTRVDKIPYNKTTGTKYEE